MAYTQRTDRAHPSFIMFLVDQSYSMSDKLAGDSRTKAEALADAVNSVLYELILRCIKNTSEGPRHYYDLAVVAYGPQNPHSGTDVGPAWGGSLAGQLVVSSKDVGNHPIRVEQRPTADGAMANLPIWFEPMTDGGTPMCAAMNLAGQTIADWIARHPDSFPPVVIHVTDGESTDGDPRVWAQRLQSLSTTDGNVLVLNLSLSAKSGSPVVFPSEAGVLPKGYARTLFEMSSVLPGFMVDLAAGQGISAQHGARGFVHNADIATVPSFFQIGTATAHLAL